MSNTVQVSAFFWWESQRVRYNLRLVTAALASFLLLVAVWWLFESRLPCLEITGLSIFASVLLFAMALFVANIFYFLGCVAEMVCRPRNVLLFRERLYALGTAFSLLLVFFPVIGNLISAALWSGASACE